MRSPVFWRRSRTAAGVYLSALLGFLGSIVAVRELGIHAFGLLALVVAATGFFQLLADLTVEEAVVKYGFRYAAREDWSRFRQAFRIGLALKLAGGLLGAAAILVLAPLSETFWTPGLFTPFLVAALLPVAQAPEGIASAALIVRQRYDVRAAFLVLSMGLRLTALAVGGLFGVVETVIALVVAQAVATAAICGAASIALRGFPRRPRERLGEDRRAFARFVFQSSLGSVLSPLRALLGTLLLGTVALPAQVAFLRVGQTPEGAFASLTAPVRLILLTDQTHAVEQGRGRLVFGTIRRYALGAGAAMLVLLPPLFVFMPDLIRIAYGSAAAGAAPAARIFLFVAAVQVVLGWSKSFPVSIGRPELRLLAQGTEIAVLVPTLVVLGDLYGATGAAVGFLVAAASFALVWGVLVLRLKRGDVTAADLVPAQQR
jgi:O-antigen/teichoic acid export membrane protein